METLWTFRIIFFMALFVLLFGDFLEYGSEKSKKSKKNTNVNNQQEITLMEFDDESTLQDLSTLNGDNKPKSYTEYFRKHKLAAQQFTEECLPKMLCQMAAKPSVSLSDREKSLLNLIKSTTMSLTWNSAPTKWHFATHMGQLMQYTSESIAGPMGCALLWPQCPISSQQLLRLSSKLHLK